MGGGGWQLYSWQNASESLRDCRIQMYGNRWRTVQESKKYFSFLFDSAVVILDANGSQTTDWMVSETKGKCLEVLFPGRALFFILRV